jgi:hypothetical protein
MVILYKYHISAPFLNFISKILYPFVVVLHPSIFSSQVIKSFMSLDISNDKSQILTSRHYVVRDNIVELVEKLQSSFRAKEPISCSFS